MFRVAARDLTRRTVKFLTQSNLDESATIAPNGTMVTYATSSAGRGVLMLASINGRVKIPLPIAAQGEIRAPSWSPFLK